MRTAAASVRGRVIVVDARGRLIADSAGAARLGRDYGGRPEVRAALAGRSVQETRHSRSLGIEILATAVPVLRTGRPAGAVRVTQSVEAVHRATRRAILGLGLIGALVLALGMAAGALIAGHVARPGAAARRRARRVAGGDLEARAPGRRLARAALAGTLVQRDDRSRRPPPARSAGLRRRCLASAAHAADRASPARRGGRGRDVASRPCARELDAALTEIDRLSLTVEELLVLSRAGSASARRARSPGRRRGAARRSAGAPAAAERGMELRLEAATGAGSRVVRAGRPRPRARRARRERAAATPPPRRR